MRRWLAGAAAAATVLMLPPSGLAAGPLVTAVADPGVGGPDTGVLLDRMKKAGATRVRLFVSWRGTAPGGATRPAGFDPRNPADPAYDWTNPDAQVRAAAAAGLAPIVTVARAPQWAERPQSGDAELPAGERIPGTLRPDAEEFGAFGEAIARRYSGTFAGLPRVRFWQAWNEPNHHNDLNPQFDVAPAENATSASRMLAPAMYRDLLNAFSAGVTSARSDNVVSSAGLAPFFRPNPGGRASAPLPFMRAMLCLTASNRPLASCPARSRFDAWAQHPYTSGNAFHSANSPDDVSLGDLPEVRRVLDAAVRAKRIEARGAVRLWVTEFSWDSNPPDQYGVPEPLLTRWVAEALHVMWRNGVELVTWFQVRDDVPAPSGVFQSGLYLRCEQGVVCDKPKPLIAAFRFPLTAYRSSDTVRLWGRTPGGRPGRVTIEQRRGGAWVQLARLKADRRGIFHRRAKRRGGGSVRARLGASTFSAGFSLRRPPDRPVNPFGNFPVDEPAKP